MKYIGNNYTLENRIQALAEAAFALGTKVSTLTLAQLDETTDKYTSEVSSISTEIRAWVKKCVIEELKERNISEVIDE